MFYRVLMYSPCPVDKRSFPCFVLLQDDAPLSSTQMDVFLPVLWDHLIQTHHREYILALATDWHRRKVAIKLASITSLLEELSVGPLRLGASGSCPRTQVPTLLTSIFGTLGYFLVTSDTLSEGDLSLCPDANMRT